MQIALTWDLLVIIFFATVLAYSFIVGKDQSVKIIIASYIAILSVQAMGNLLARMANSSQWMLDMMGFELNMDIVTVIKLILLIGVIIFLAVRGGFEMEYAENITGLWETLIVGLFGFSTAGLLLTALLTTVAGKPLLDATLGAAPMLMPLLADSSLLQIMVAYQNAWIALPAVLLVGIGIAANRE